MNKNIEQLYKERDQLSKEYAILAREYCDHNWLCLPDRLKWQDIYNQLKLLDQQIAVYKNGGPLLHGV